MFLKNCEILEESFYYSWFSIFWGFSSCNFFICCGGYLLNESHLSGQFSVFACVDACAFMGIYVYVLVHRGTLVCTWMWRSENNLSCHLQEYHPLSLRKGLSLPWISTVSFSNYWVNILDMSVYFPNIEMASMCYHGCIFMNSGLHTSKTIILSTESSWQILL